MPYQSTKPAAADYMSVSQGDLQGNFLALKAAIDVNHETFGSAYEGKHSMVSLPQQTVSAVPPVFPLATSATELGLYAAVSGGATHLFLRPVSQTAGVATNDINLTNAGKTTTGWCVLPCGIILKWGKGTITAANTLGVTSTAVLASGANVPTITTLLLPLVTKEGSNELIVSYMSFSEAAHTVTVTAFKAFSGNNTTTFDYLLIGF